MKTAPGSLGVDGSSSTIINQAKTKLKFRFNLNKAFPGGPRGKRRNHWAGPVGGGGEGPQGEICGPDPLEVELLFGGQLQRNTSAWPCEGRVWDGRPPTPDRAGDPQCTVSPRNPFSIHWVKDLCVDMGPQFVSLRTHVMPDVAVLCLYSQLTHNKMRGRDRISGSS